MAGDLSPRTNTNCKLPKKKKVDKISRLCTVTAKKRQTVP